ncbi:MULTISPECIES: folylpolyglutamate synthase/dihydrofolate synthase family protein [unclassified Leeuwenhoekiella]|uniref:bifunctional folylpolyglutamate synthase/dihydrofolate synthase n=1 Tax=unclassified Leeuwenhoekiella TaxID=2615029 RepID=UPI000C6B639E|nr:MULTISPECIES: folylpolyglutamate synthase/dihydrofolate synthase family protein [unclassified Leeuwenhoekiella]MAW96444.1 tetrahydrofolate synthase [Leeuwenhoekiella sp.]MBA81331.1 tetrahydrofolate synthase [Leeuwenhoekiella sp.]|tara:strand:+ start:11248 stop:12471 length:1224 start_codon:yes stop_codon:yes gene_type:complete
MTYDQTVQWMFNRLPMYQRQGASAFRKDLSNTILLDEHLGNPHTVFKTIHVAGTNGKGSTSHMLASVLQEAGYKVGLYTSPHLKDFRERIRINGEMCTQDYVVSFIDEHKTFLEQHQLSFFELTVGMAFQYFKNERVDVAVIEVGMGGRLDSTNIITPILSIITNIGMDHTAFLGNTLAEIAGEKAGVIKPHIPIVIGERQEETTAVFEEKAAREQAPLFFASDEAFPGLESELKGRYQTHNIKTVQKAVEVLRLFSDLEIGEQHLINGLARVVTNTGLTGRWQILQDSGPRIICDTGHNKEGLLQVFAQLTQEKFEQLHIVLGVVSDKDLESVLPLFPVQAYYYFSKPDVPRGLDAGILQDQAAQFGLNGKKYKTISEALEAAKRSATVEDLIFIGGSTFVVAEIV